MHELTKLKTELDRLDTYLSLLTEDYRRILTLYYIEGRPLRIIEQELGYSRRTLSRKKADGLEQLANMYEYTERFFETV